MKERSGRNDEKAEKLEADEIDFGCQAIAPYFAQNAARVKDGQRPSVATSNQRTALRFLLAIPRERNEPVSVVPRRLVSSHPLIYSCQDRRRKGNYAGNRKAFHIANLVL